MDKVEFHAARRVACMRKICIKVKDLKSCAKRAKGVTSVGDICEVIYSE